MITRISYKSLFWLWLTNLPVLALNLLQFTLYSSDKSSVEIFWMMLHLYFKIKMTWSLKLLHFTLSIRPSYGCRSILSSSNENRLNFMHNVEDHKKSNFDFGLDHFSILELCPFLLCLELVHRCHWDTFCQFFFTASIFSCDFGIISPKLSKL